MIRKGLGYLGMALVLGACVTINIYFPAAAAEEAARVIVRDVLESGGSEPEQAPPAPPDDKQSALPLALDVLAMGVRVIERLVPPAAAAQADINISTPAINALRGKMERRQGSLAAYYLSGAIGFDSRGLVAVRDLNAVPLAERNKVKKLVAEENADRQALYREIARANAHPEWEQDISATFAKVWVEEAPRGYWYQTASGGWQQR
jgi:uncharacterized protein YdbL (DUF1318 family)